MSGPKHLWSGDWQQESAAASQDLAGRRPLPPDPEPAVPAGPEPRPRRRGLAMLRRRRVLALALGLVLLLAAGAYGLNALRGGSSRDGLSPAAGAPPQQAPSTPVFQGAPAPSQALRPINWLGMEIETVPPGLAVIDTVGRGTPGELAGLEPGDTILAIDNRPIHGSGDIAPAIRGLRAGDAVQVQISHGSSLSAKQLTLAAPPSRYP